MRPKKRKMIGSRGLLAADQELRVLQHIRAGRTMRQAASAEGLKESRVKAIVEEVMREAALEPLKLGKHALHRELLRLSAVTKSAFEIKDARCPTCDGTLSDCPDCRATRYRYTATERLEAGDQIIDAATAWENLAGPALRAAAGNWGPLLTLPQRCRNALGETTKEDFEALLDAYATQKDLDFVARAFDNRPTHFPKLARQIFAEFTRRLPPSEDVVAPDTRTTTPARAPARKANTKAPHSQPQPAPNVTEAAAKDPSRDDHGPDGYHGREFGAEPIDNDFRPPPKEERER